MVEAKVGIINYYRDMWIHRSKVLSPRDECQKALEEIKRIVSRETLLAYPNFDKTFEIFRIRNKKINLGNEVFTCLDDCINANYNYQSARSQMRSHRNNLKD